MKETSLTGLFNLLCLLVAQEGHLHCLVWLAKHSGTAHIDMSVDGMTAAHAAALEGHLECMAFLLSSAGCSAVARDRAANTPLHYGTKAGFFFLDSKIQIVRSVYVV